MARRVFEKPVVLWELGMCPVFVENPSEVVLLLLLSAVEETSFARGTIVFIDLKVKASFLFISCYSDCILN